jgi:hypothetical protein
MLNRLGLAAFAAVLLAAAPSHAAGPKTYQVTGPILAIDSDTITVQKGNEKWQIARGAANISADAKVGAKVTITYTMAATQVEVKADKAAKHP